MIKRLIASVLVLAMMTSFGVVNYVNTFSRAMAEDDELLAWLILAEYLEEQEKSSKKKKKKSSTKKNTTKKSTTKSSGNSASTQATYTLSDVTPYDAVVRTNGGNLNIRKTASAEAAVLMELSNGSAVKVTGQTTNGWLRVEAGNVTGFVSSRYITASIKVPEKPVNTGTAAAKSDGYYVIANPINNFVNLRAGASTSTEVVGVYHYGSVLRVIGEEGDWSKVEDEATGKTGYIKSNQLQRADDPSDDSHG